MHGYVSIEVNNSTTDFSVLMDCFNGSFCEALMFTCWRSLCEMTHIMKTSRITAKCVCCHYIFILLSLNADNLRYNNKLSCETSVLGFRYNQDSHQTLKFSHETRLSSSSNELLSNMDHNYLTGASFSDFSRTFGRVLHERLSYK